MSNINLEEFLTDFRTLIDQHLGTEAVEGEAPTKAAKKSSKGKATKAQTPPEPEVEDEADDEAEENDLSERVAELKKKKITTLRKMAVELGFEEDEVAEAEKEEIAQAIAEAEAEDESEDEDAEDEDEDAEVEEDEEEAEEGDDEEDESDEDESDEYTRDDYLSMSLADLKGIAKEAGYKAADLKGLDKDGIADLLLGEESEESDEDEEEALSEEDLREMSLAELKALCKDYGIKVPRGAKQDDLVDLLMEDDEE